MTHQFFVKLVSNENKRFVSYFKVFESLFLKCSKSSTSFGCYKVCETVETVKVNTGRLGKLRILKNGVVN